MWKQLAEAYKDMQTEKASQGMFVVVQGSKYEVLGQFKDKKKAMDLMKKNPKSKTIQIGKFATVDDKPIDIKVGDKLSYTRFKMSTKIKEDLDEKTKIEFKPNPSDSNKTMIMKKGKEMGNIIKTNKGFQVMQFDKPAGKVFKSLNDIKPAIRKMYGEAVNPNCDCVDCNCDPCECGDWREGMGPEGGGHKTSDAEGLGEETLVELSAEEKKLIDKMYDKKGNLTPIGKAVMDAGKKAAAKKK